MSDTPEPEELEPEQEQEAPAVEADAEGGDRGPVRSTAPTAPGIRFNDRVLVLGGTGSGKSELVNHQFSAIRCQRLLLDTKDEWAIPGVEPVRGDVAAIDWRAPVIHYVVGEAGDMAEVDDLFAACFGRRHLVVASHELEDLCDYNANRVPAKVNSYLSKGRTHGLGLLGAAQRPLEIPKRARTEAQHFFVTVNEPDDLGEVAKLFRLSLGNLQAALEEARDQHGDFAFLWYDKRAAEITVCPELPDHVRAATMVKRVSVA